MGLPGHSHTPWQGVSLIMPSTAKGQRLVEMVRPHMLMEERTVAEAVDGNGQLKRPSTCPPERAAFVSGYARLGEAVFAPLLRGYKRGYRVDMLKRIIIRMLSDYPMLLALLKGTYNKFK